ncbi:MAG: MoaD/ThiS family protein [Acidobacteria bacterium]|nr:MoaD/ThiS family protein [Acidobacteriota bacterium]
MPEIDLTALGEARKMVGFSQKKIELSGHTVAELLRAIGTLDGENLYEKLVCQGKLRGDYAVLVNGLSVKPDQLDMEVKQGDQVVTMAILRHLHGG